MEIAKPACPCFSNSQNKGSTGGLLAKPFLLEPAFVKEMLITGWVAGLHRKELRDGKSRAEGEPFNPGQH